MTQLAHETLRQADSVVCRDVYPAAPSASDDRQADLARIVRRALRNPGSDTPLSQAIRAAAAELVEDGWIADDEDETLRVQLVTRRLDAILSERAAASRAHATHWESVRN